MSKAHMPHWRYVAIKMEGKAVSRRSMQNALTGMARKHEVPEDRLPNLTRYEWPHAVVRFRHMDLEAGRRWLPTMAFVVEKGEKVALTIETLSSSGTIKTLTDRLGILQKR